MYMEMLIITKVEAWTSTIHYKNVVFRQRENRLVDRAKRKQIGWCQVLWQIIVPLLKLLVLLYQVIIEKGTCMFVFHFLVYLEVDDV